MKRIKKVSLITALICALNIIAIPVSADNDYISISTADDLITLSKNCISDSYSVGKTVILTNDIELSGSNFETIGSFGGTFDGAGYTIYGMDLSTVDSVRGFIGTITETGEVKNLNIEGEIAPEKEVKNNGIARLNDALGNKGDSSILQGIERYTSDDGIKCIGGIAGENNGKIINCTFSGTVRGDENIGGIVGENNQNGRIESCINYASVTGNTNTGGIAGKNYGLIKWSYNNGLINPTANEAAQNTGGIAGRSYGAILESVNNSEIGYKNAGYNTGGITGCQNGYIAECINYGHIQGRKDIGGITGQFEPYTNIDFSQDEIQKRVDENIETLKSDLRKADQNVNDKYETIKDDINSFRDNFGLNDRGFSTGAVSDAVNSVSDSIVDSNAKISDSLANANDQLSEASSRIAEAADKLAEAGSGISESLSDSSERISDRFDESGENLDTAVNDMVTILRAVSDCAEAISNDTSNTTETLIELLETSNNSLKSGSENSEELIRSMIDMINDAELDMNDLGVDVNLNTSDLSRSLRTVASNLNNNMNDIAEPLLRAADTLDGIMDDIASKKETLDNAAEALNKILDEVNSVKATAAPGTGIPNPTYMPIVIPTSIPVNSDNISDNIDNIKNILDKIFGALQTTAYAEETDVSTAKKLMDMDIKDMDISINRTVAGEIMDAALIKYCINDGTIEGLSDVGGIAGAVGFDSAANPEDNFNVSGDYSLNPSTAIKAVINASINEGEITAKNTSAGGIIGFADIGAVKQSMSNGPVTVTDGNYAGGIAGYSSNNITKSISMSDIKALGYAGGIAGKGTNIDTCYALARIDCDGEKIGAIAGTAEGNIKYNYFLDEGLSGIDGVNYEAKAQPEGEDVLVSTGELSPELTGFSDEDWYVGSDDKYLPQLRAIAENDASGIGDMLKLKSAEFTRFIFKVRFFNNGKEIKSIHLNYGEKIPKEDIPQLEKRNGTYGDWDKDVNQKIIRNTDFYSVYEQSTTTIAYGTEPAVILVEGNFRPGTVLDVEESSADPVNDRNYITDKKYSFTITEDVGEYTGDVTVRVMDKSKKGIIGVIEDGSVNIVESEVDGSYIKFKMASPGEFVILNKKPNYAIPIAGAAAGALIIAAVAVFIINKRKKRQTGV